MDNALLSQLGINWQLFLSQVVNFFILLGTLWYFAYRPLLRIIKQRNAKIQEGLDKAKEADLRLHEIDEIAKERLKEADQKSIAMIQATEARAKTLEKKMQETMEVEEAHLQRQMQERVKKQEADAKEKVMREAAGLVRETLVKTVELRPEAIDDALISKAVAKIKSS